MFFYDPTLSLYISTSPLLVSSRVLAAARKADVSVHWNEKGQICGISHAEAKLLCKELGIKILNVADFMALVARVPSVESHDFAEWLDETYTIRDGAFFDSVGNEVCLRTARPGWFDVADIDERGYPKRVNRYNAGGKWKLWTPAHPEHKMAAMRSFVTSSGTCSLDLGIPTFAKHPMIMIRECYCTEFVEEESTLAYTWSLYQSLTLSRDDGAIRQFFLTLDTGALKERKTMDEFVRTKEREMLVDLRGKRRLLLQDYAGLRPLGLRDLQERLSLPIDDVATLVLGHPNPDADSIVSSVFEAARRTILNPERPSLPWAEKIPHEVSHILGPTLSSLVSKSPYPRSSHDFVLVDCHTVAKAHRHQVKSIVDHHIITRQFPYYVSVSQEVSWSSTLQIFIKLLGSGLDLTGETAKILLEATRLEADPELMMYMSELDRLALKRLEEIAVSPMGYIALMQIMTDRTGSDKDAFYKDYKQTTYGFAVIKTCQSRDYSEIARLNNIAEHLPLTIVKEVLYDQTFSKIRSEAFALSFHTKFYDKGFRKAVRHVLRVACEVFHGTSAQVPGCDTIVLSNITKQTPRLLLMPLIEEIVKEHLKFTFSESTRLYISCGFYNGQETLFGEPGTSQDVQAELSFEMVESILSGSHNTLFLSLPQYWKVYHELSSNNDKRSMASLQDSDYVELLNTILTVTPSPIQVAKTKSDALPRHTGRSAKHGNELVYLQDVPYAQPGLIRPDNCCETTGLPKEIESPDTYGDLGLWRYWSPDAEVNVATRGHIFVMNQTCIDLKIRPDECTKRLTFRPVYRNIPDLQYSVCVAADLHQNQDWVDLLIYPRLFSIYDI